VTVVVTPDQQGTSSFVHDNSGDAHRMARLLSHRRGYLLQCAPARTVHV